MDGVESRLSGSLRLRLSLWLALVIFAVALIAAAVSFVLSFNEAHELQDNMLRQTAALFDARHLPAPRPRGRMPRSDVDPEARLRVALLGDSQGHRSRSGESIFPPDLTDGLQTRRLGDRSYRIFLRRLGPNEHVAVAQQTAIRDETASYSALLALLPFLVLVPLLLVLVTVLIRAVFAPVTVLAAAVDRRSDQDLLPIAAPSLPREIAPFVNAINRLLARVAEGMALQQRFIAAAAHELRSPLTALSLQAERLAGSGMGARARQRLAVLRQGIDRNRALLDQLLAYSRAQSAPNTRLAAVDVHDLFRRVLEELMPLVEQKHLNAGVEGEGLRIVIDETALTAAIRNIVANAIRYTPAGGRIDLTAERTDSAVVIVIEDNGPGVAPADREHLFEPFFRTLGTGVPGSGLGLSIVKSLATRMEAQVEVYPAQRYQSGLRVTIRLPGEASCTHAAVKQRPA